MQSFGARQRRDPDRRIDSAQGRNRGTACFLEIVAARGEHVVALHGEACLHEVRGHCRAHDAQADHADGFAHFLFFPAFFARFFAGFFLDEPSGFAFTSTAAMTQGSFPRTLQEWWVPRWTRMSPARSSFSPVSMMAWISPL